MLQALENEYCKVDVHFTADSELVKQKRQEAVIDLRKVAKIPGFRQGKAPDYAIKIQMKPQIEEWLKRELVSVAYDETLYETKLKPIGYPNINRVELHDDVFFCDLTFYKSPEFELKQYKDFELPRPAPTNDPKAEAGKFIRDLQMEMGTSSTFTENDRVQIEDKITLDYLCTFEDKKLEDYSAEGAFYQVGQNKLPGLDDELIGMMAGETKEFKLSLPISYDEINSVVNCKATVHMGLRLTPHPLDNELAKKAGGDKPDAIIEELMGQVESYYTTQNKQMELHQLTQQLITRILTNHSEFEIPSWLVQAEAPMVAQQMGKEFKTLPENEKMEVLEQAKKNIRWTLVLEAIRNAEPECVFSEQEILNLLRTKLTEQGKDTEKVIHQMQKDGSLVGWIAKVKTDSMVQWLLEKSTIVD